MTIPSSGPISLSQIAAEFGLASTTPFPSGFYGLGGAPSSGPLSFADFYGRSAVTFTPDGGSVNDEETYTASVTLTCSSAATWTYAVSSGSGGVPSVNVTSGASATSITFTLTATGGTGHKLSGSKSWNVTGVSNGVTRNFTVTLTVDGDAP